MVLFLDISENRGLSVLPRFSEMSEKQPKFLAPAKPPPVRIKSVLQRLVPAQSPGSDDSDYIS